MPNVYQTVFGGSLVAPAIPTYLALNMSASVVLGWPLESNITFPSVAEIIDVNATNPALTVQLSDARQIGNGYCSLFNNVGANTFTLLDAQGNTLMAPTSGQAWQIYLADNSTLQGTWRVFQYGASVSSANAATLQGNGLKAITTTLNERIVINAQGSNYTILTTDRAACVEWTGGSGGTFTAPSPATVGSDWFCYLKNSGTGVLTLSPTTGTIDGTASKTFNPNDSCILASDGTNLFTMGFGQSVASSFNFVTISLAGASGTVILTGAQLNRISYKFTGALAGNTVIQVPASIQQYWIDNETTGAFTLTISAGGAGTTFTVPQASRTILYCDGLNIVNAISSGSIQFADGTAAAPSITFASDTTLGLYKAGTDTLGVSTAGVQRAVLNANGQLTLNAPSSGTSLTVNNSSAAAAVAAQILSAFSSVSASPLLSLKSTLVGGFATLSLCGNNGTIGTNDLSIFQNGSTLDASVLNNQNAALHLGTNASNRIDISGTGAVSINQPTSGVALTITGQNPSNAVNITTGANTAAVSASGGFISSTNALGTAVTPGTTGVYINGGNSGEIIRVNSGGAADSKVWSTFVDATTLHSRVINDALNATVDWLNVTRSGTGITGINFLTAGVNRLSLSAAAILGQGPTAAALVDMTPDSGVFTPTNTGFASTTTNTAAWYRIGKMVILLLNISGTSNSASWQITNLPAAIQPPTTGQFRNCQVTDNGASNLGAAISIPAASATITFGISRTNVTTNEVAYPGGAFTASGTRAISDSIVYMLG